MEQIIDQLKGMDDPSMPDWAKLLIQSMQIILSEIKLVKELAERVNKLEDFKAINERVTEELKSENSRLKDRLEVLESAVDDQEQRSRNFCLMIHGVKEEEDEDTDVHVLKVLNGDLGLPIALENIQRSHRIGPRNSGRNTRQNQTKPRPIFLRFRDFRSRQSAYRNKKKLKGTGVNITESLTKRRYALYKLAIAKFGIGNCWTSEGRVTTKIDNVYKIISSESDL